MKLRSWQAEAFPLWWEKQQGIIKVVTGGGKTFFAIYCIKEYLKTSPKKDILIVVPSIALLDQWNEALLENNINHEILLNGGGEKVDKSAKIIVTTIDSLKNILDLVNAENSLLIVDECHKIGTEKRGDMLTNKWSATLGLSATPERDYDDNFYVIIKKILGDIIFEYDYIDARDDEVIVNFSLLYAYAPLLKEEEKKYENFSKSIRRRAAIIGGHNMDDYPLKMNVFNRARLIKNSKNRTVLIFKKRRRLLSTILI